MAHTTPLKPEIVLSRHCMYSMHTVTVHVRTLALPFPCHWKAATELTPRKMYTKKFLQKIHLCCIALKTKTYEGTGFKQLLNKNER